MGKSEKKRILLTFLTGAALIAATLTACMASPSQPELDSPDVGAPQEVQRITLEASKTAFDSDAAVFLDVRSSDSHAASHIPDAISIPLGELDGRLGELDPDQWIITYCT